MIIDRLDLKAATTLLHNQTKNHYGWLTLCKETGLQMAAAKTDAGIPTWVAINEHDRMTKSMWHEGPRAQNSKDFIFNGGKVSETEGSTSIEFKEFKRTLNNTDHPELDIQLFNKDTTKIVSNNQTFTLECYGIPEHMLRLTGELRGKVLGHTKLSGNLYRVFKAMRLLGFAPVSISWNSQFVLSKQKIGEDDEVIESIHATCDAETPIQGITAKVVGYDFIESLGRIGKAMWKNGTVEITLYERMIDFYLVAQRKSTSSKIHFRTIIPLQLTGTAHDAEHDKKREIQGICFPYPSRD